MNIDDRDGERNPEGDHKLDKKKDWNSGNPEETRDLPVIIRQQREYWQGEKKVNAFGQNDGGQEEVPGKRKFLDKALVGFQGDSGGPHRI